MGLYFRQGGVTYDLVFQAPENTFSPSFNPLVSLNHNPTTNVWILPQPATILITPYRARLSFGSGTSSLLPPKDNLCYVTYAASSRP
jgi:hypothetical protein